MMVIKVFWCLLSTMLLVRFVVCGPHERALIVDLMKDYQKLERPVPNETQPVQLNFEVTLQQIIDLDEKNQLLKTNIWLDYSWIDYSLIWNKSDYGGIEDVRMPPYSLWTPDLLMYNSASAEFDPTYPTNIIVTSTGHLSYIPPGIFVSTCKIDITWFPFDDQECILKFGSWTYDTRGLNITLVSNVGDLSEYQTNGEWELLAFPAKRNEKKYECCVYTFLDVTYTLKIRRRTLYYFANLILPCVLIASMSVLGFYFPPESGEKVTLEITILMSLTFFMNVVSDMQPPSSETPLIGTYFSCIMIMVASSVVCTILVLNYHHRLASSEPMPHWVKTLFLQWLPWALRMSRPGNKITRKSIYLQNKMRKLELGDKHSKSLLSNVLDMEDDYFFGPRTGVSNDTGLHLNLSPSSSLAVNQQPLTSNGHLISPDVDPSEGQPPLSRPNCPAKAANGTGTTPLSNGLPSSKSQLMQDTSSKPVGIELELREILREIRVVTNKIRAEAEASALENEWKFAAMVLDRICLIAFTLFTVLLSAAVLLAAPHVIVW